MHRWTFLCADAVVEEILAGQTVALLGAGTPAGAKKMATLAWIRAEAPALPTLGRAVRLRVPLTVLWAFAPATLFAACITVRTSALRRRKVVHVEVPAALPGNYFLPIDSLDVAEVVVVVHAHAPVEYVCGMINQGELDADRFY